MADDDKTDFGALKDALDALGPKVASVAAAFKTALTEMNTLKQGSGELKSRLEGLNLLFDAQNQKVRDASIAYKFLASEKGKNSTEAKILEAALNKERNALNDLEDKIANTTEALKQIKNGGEEAKQGLSTIEASSIVLKEAVGDLGQAIVNNPVKAFKETLEVADSVQQSLEAVTGIFQGGADAAKDLGGAVDEESGKLENMNTELATTNTALLEVKDDSEKAGQGMKEAGEKSEALKGIMTGLAATVKVAAQAFVAVIGVVQSVAGAIGNLVFSNASAADKLAELSQQTGLSTEKLQEMQFTSTLLGTSLDTFTGSQSKLLSSMQAAQGGADEQAKAFASLGVNVLDANGHMRDSQSVFGESLDALKAIQDPTERNAKAMAIFGKSAQELGPLINAGSAGLAEYAQQAHEMGAVVDGESVQALSAFQNQFDGIKLGLQGVGATIATAFLPAFSGIATEAEGHLKDLAQVVNGSDGDLGKMSEGIGQWFSQAANDIAATAPQMLQAAANTMKAVLDGLTNALPSLVTAATDIIQSLVLFLGDSLPILIDSGVSILLALANGLTAALPTLLPTVATVIVKIMEALINNLPQLITAGLMLLTALATGLVAALPILITAIPKLYKSLLDGLMAASPQLALVAGDLIGVLAVGIVTAIPLILNALIQVYQALFTMLSSEEFKQKITVAGLSLILGMWQGIQSGWGTLTTGFSDLFRVLTDAGQIIQDVAGLGGRIIQQLIAALLAGVANMATSALILLLSFISGFVTSLFMLPLLGLTIMEQLVTGLLTGVLGMATSAFTLLQTFISGFINNLFMLPLLGATIIQQLVDSLLAGILSIANSAITLLQEFVKGFEENLDTLATIGTTVTNFIADEVRKKIKTVTDAGGDLIAGLWEGIQTRWQEMLGDFQDLLEGLPQAIKDILGIASPSKVGIELGTFFSAGFGIGLLDEMTRVQRRLQGAMEELTPNLTFPGSQGFATSTTSVTNDNFGFNNYGTVYLNGPQTPGNISARIKAKRF